MHMPACSQGQGHGFPGIYTARDAPGTLGSATDPQSVPTGTAMCTSAPRHDMPILLWFRPCSDAAGSHTRSSHGDQGGTPTLDLVIHPLPLIAVAVREDVQAPPPAVLLLEVALVAAPVCVLGFPLPSVGTILVECRAQAAPAAVSRHPSLPNTSSYKPDSHCCLVPLACTASWHGHRMPFAADISANTERERFISVSKPSHS